MEYIFYPAAVMLKRKNNTAKLPDNFVMLVSLENEYGYVPCSTFMEQGRINELGEYKTDSFVIIKNECHFKDSFSKNIFARFFQKLSEFLSPRMYLLKYINKEQYSEELLFNIREGKTKIAKRY